MKRLSIVAALVAIGVAVPLSIGSSHREAPLTSIDPTADDTDVYAYTAKDAQDALTVVANWVPFEDPAGGPNFYRFDPKARYYINVDNTGDGKYDVRYRFKFRDSGTERRKLVPVRVPGRDVDRRPEAAPEAVLRRGAAARTATRRALRPRRRGRSTRARASRASTSRKRQQALEARAAQRAARSRATSRWRRTTSGRRRSRTTTKVANQAITELPGGGKVFAGQRDDPFFVDLGMTFDAINLDGSCPEQGKAVDDLAGYGVHSIVLQVPEEKVTKDGDEVDSANDKNAVVGVWASTERKRVSVLASSSAATTMTTNGDRDSGTTGPGLAPREPARERGHHPARAEGQVQPHDSGRRRRAYGKFVVKPELAGLMNALFGRGTRPRRTAWTSSRQCSRAAGPEQPADRQAGRHDQGQPRHSADGQPEPPRRARRATRRATRTAAG